jgi:hypothetical protein
MEEPTEEVGTSVIPVETTSEGPDLDLPWTTAHTVRRKAAKRSEEWYQNGSGPLLIPARKKRRIEEPPQTLPASTDEASSNITVFAESSEGLPPPASTPPSTDTVNASTRCQSSRNTQTQLKPIEKSEAQLDGDDDDADADADLSAPSWRDHLSELADYRKIHGHCYVPNKYSENSRLATWVANQRQQYTLHLEGKESSMTLSRIQELESLGFKWRVYYVHAAWEDRLSELADYRRIHGHCNVPSRYSENAKLGTWVRTQRQQYTLQQKGKASPMTTFRIQELESLGFEWPYLTANWEDRLSELADFRKIHGHCNVPESYSENTKLGYWVANLRTEYRRKQQGRKSSMTTFRIQELKSLGFEWDRLGAAWEIRLSELADYRRIHGHCNVPTNYSENTKLARWVAYQRSNYRLQQQGKKSPMTLSRIQELESLGFEWDRYGAT